MNRNYLKGRRFEYQVARHFQGLGCATTRSSGSHGLWDVVAVAVGPSISMAVRLWLNDQDSVPEKGFLSRSLDWPGTKNLKRIYYRVIQDSNHDLVLLAQCKTKQS